MIAVAQLKEHEHSDFSDLINMFISHDDVYCDSKDDVLNAIVDSLDLSQIKHLKTICLSRMDYQSKGKEALEAGGKADEGIAYSWF